MSFLETPRFPEELSFGAQGGASYMTNVVTTNGGAEFRDVIWAQGRGRWDVSHAARTEAQHAILNAFFRAVHGRAHGFRFKDWLDYKATTANGTLATGVGDGTPTHQLTKTYTAGALSEHRSILKPVGTPIIYRNATPAVAGSAAGQYALDSTTGIVTWVADAAQGISSIAVGASTVLTCASALTGAAPTEYVYITGCDGTLGALLNGVAWLITTVSGSDVTIAAGDTTGLTYGTAGVASMYPQASDALTWAGEFDVPVRFDTDQMTAELFDRSGTTFMVNWNSIPLVELRG